MNRPADLRQTSVVWCELGGNRALAFEQPPLPHKKRYKVTLGSNHTRYAPATGHRPSQHRGPKGLRLRCMLCRVRAVGTMLCRAVTSGWQSADSSFCSEIPTTPADRCPTTKKRGCGCQGARPLHAMGVRSVPTCQVWACRRPLFPSDSQLFRMN